METANGADEAVQAEHRYPPERGPAPYHLHPAVARYAPVVDDFFVQHRQWKHRLRRERQPSVFASPSAGQESFGKPPNEPPEKSSKESTSSPSTV
jgi:hypothetical protein